MIVDYIDDHKDRFGVDPICRVLTEHGMQIAPSTYYDHLAKRAAPARLSDRAQRDEALSRISVSEGLSDLGKSELVIEAVTEDIAQPAQAQGAGVIGQIRHQDGA